MALQERHSPDRVSAARKSVTSIATIKTSRVSGYCAGEPVSFALFFHNFSTFLGRPGIYLKDLFVKPEMPGRGIGRVMLAYLACLAQERKCGCLEWSVLDWNESAIMFYQSLRAEAMDQWTRHGLTGLALAELADEF